MKNNQTIWVLGHKITLHPTSGNYDLAVIESPPEAKGPPPHMHKNYDESFLILEGELEFTINGEQKICKAGDSLDVPSGTLHTFKNTKKYACKWTNIHSPKGFSGFFEEFGIPTTENDANQKSIHPEIIAKVMKTAGDFDMHITLPALA